MSGWKPSCCEVCDRNPKCGVDCGSCHVCERCHGLGCVYTPEGVADCTCAAFGTGWEPNPPKTENPEKNSDPNGN